MTTKFIVATLSLGLITAASAGTQFGIGLGGYKGTNFDEPGYGINAELGGLYDQAPVDLFTGFKATYVDGLSDGGTILGSDTDMDLFEGSFVARVLFPLGNEHIKLYGEGSVGAANLQVSGKASARAKVGGREFSINSRFDENTWVLSWGLGAGVQLDLTPNIGIRAGYSFQSFGDVEIFGLKEDPGSLHGFNASLVFKF